MTNIRSTVVLILSIFVLSSCEKNDPASPLPFASPPSFAGTWNDPELPMSITLSESNGELRGGGMLFNAFSLTVQGKNQYPTMTFTIGTPGYQSAVVKGTLVTKDSLVGTLTGSGFSDRPCHLKRTP